jgi:hypothetical protein
MDRDCLQLDDTEIKTLDGDAWPVYDRSADFWGAYFVLVDPYWHNRDPAYESEKSPCMWWMGKRPRYSVPRLSGNCNCLDDARANGSLLFYYGGKRYSARLLLYASMAAAGLLGPAHEIVDIPMRGRHQRLKSKCHNYNCVNPHHHSYNAAATKRRREYDRAPHRKQHLGRAKRARKDDRDVYLDGTTSATDEMWAMWIEAAQKIPPYRY